jgi:hypothetical protein
MSNRSKIIISVTAILLMPILLGMTPLNMAHKIGAGCPFSQGKQAITCNPCPFNSLVSQQDDITVSLTPALLEQEETPSSYGFILAHKLALPNNPSNSVPLRC